MASGSASRRFSPVVPCGRRKHRFSGLQPRRPTRLVTGLAACSLFAASLALWLPGAAGAQRDVLLGSATGGTKASFTVQFTAELSERGTAEQPLDFYVVNISGPPGCREVHAYTTENVTAGQLVTLRVAPSNIKPFGEARQWCVGRYSGSVYFCYCERGDPRPNVPVGSVGFTVRGPANYSGKTSQGKGIRFTLSAAGTRIKQFSTVVRFRCQVGGRSHTISAPVRQGPRDRITFGNGTFRVSQSETSEGVRATFELTGRLAGGTFQGQLRDRGSGHGVRCDSGSIAWSAR